MIRLVLVSFTCCSYAVDVPPNEQRYSQSYAEENSLQFMSDLVHASRQLRGINPSKALVHLLMIFHPAAGWQSAGQGISRATIKNHTSKRTKADLMISGTGCDISSSSSSLSFSHVHAYCDTLKPLSEYKLLEKKLNVFAKLTPDGIEAGRKAWLDLSEKHGNPITGVKDPAEWMGAEQDVVEQLLVGLGWRITGKHVGSSTHSLVVTSPAKQGATFIFTAHTKKAMNGEATDLSSESAFDREVSDLDPDHFSASHLERSAQYRAGRPGFTVLGFDVQPGGVDLIHARYLEKHPELLVPGTPHEYEGFRVLEAFAYYKGEAKNSEVDRGTLLRFVEVPLDKNTVHVLPGIESVEACFEDNAKFPAYCDHWVSNVVSRTGFIDTLEDTLGFSSKVDFNAGVVAAGEAQIESTVVGNNPKVKMDDERMALKNQEQVYLPINNALSDVGHVHLFLEEIGQGIQHIASRVSDLPSLIQHANDMRRVTGAGLSFLNIPQSYYGTLRKDVMAKDLNIETSTVEQYISSLQQAGIVSLDDTVDLDSSREEVEAALPPKVAPEVVEYVLRARYCNLYDLLRDALDEEEYLSIVRNKILVDIQGGDLLMQIFSAPVMQRKAGQEAPFFEFIQRVCSVAQDPLTGEALPLKPGCGGFGIRNFLTLFLSIEVSKAAKQRADAIATGDKEMAAYYGQMVDTFTEQLEESNPILTLISDAMTEEGEALAKGDVETALRCKGEKERGQETLMEISTKYNNIMKKIREKAPEMSPTVR